MDQELRAIRNRENAAKSTGPKSEAGKKKSSLNAMRHGLTSQVVVLPHEDMALYNAHVQSYVDHWKPEGVMEKQYVTMLASDAWKLNRADAAMDQMIALDYDAEAAKVLCESEQLHPALVIASLMEKKSKSIDNMSRHVSRLQRQIAANQKILTEMQAKRKEQEQKDLYVAANLLEAHKAHSKTKYDPATDGFVLSLAQIEQFIARDARRWEASQYASKRKIGA